MIKTIINLASLRAKAVVDCAIASNAHYIVTQDRDFNILKSIKFPKVELANIDKFKILLFGEE